jgi:hypothetical protein
MENKQSGKHICEFKRYTRKSPSEQVILREFIAPLFKCIGCRTTISLCRLCGKEYSMKDIDFDTIRSWNDVKYAHMFYYIDVSTFLEKTGHNSSCPRMHIHNKTRCIKFDHFMEQNPQLAFVNSDYKPNENDKGSNVINFYLLANYNCANCGNEYETFPSFHDAIRHLDNCLVKSSCFGRGAPFAVR